MPESEPLALSITHADGRVTRWGPDEPNGQDIPNDLTFGDSIPGGYRDLSTSLLRRIDVQHPDEALFDEVRAYGAGGRTAWEGVMQQFPRTHGAGFGVSPGAVGWATVLRWDPSFREIYIDQDLSRWTPPSAARRLAMAAAGVKYTEASIAFDATNALPAIVAISEFPAPSGQSSEMVYDAGAGLEVAKIRYAFNAGAGTSFSDANWSWGFAVYATDALSAAVASSGDLSTAASGSGFFTPGTPARIGYVYFQYAVLAGGTGQRFELHWQAFAVYGNHGVTLRESGGGSSLAGGYYASDVIADILTRTAPQLSYTTGAGGSIQPTSFAIPHLVFRDPTTAEDAISAINAYHLYDWGVYDNREFFYRQPDPNRLLWEARLSDGAHLDADGDTAEQVINGVFVNYNDPSGVTKTVGPPGGTFDDTDSLLEDTSSSNPVNAHGLGRKWVPLNLSFPTTLAGATQIGATYLAERSLAGRRGRLTLTGTATHPTEGKVACWRPRSGDWISLKDVNGSTVPRKIINKTYTHGGRQVTLDLDNTVAKLDAILARVGVQAGITTGSGF